MENEDNRNTEGSTQGNTQNGNGRPHVDTDVAGFIGRDLFIKATKRPSRTKEIIFPPHTDWAGAKLTIKELRAGERSRIQSSLVKGKGTDQKVDTTELQARTIIAGTINQDGTPMFDLKRDLLFVMDMPSSCAEFLEDEINDLTGGKKKDEDEETALGNSTSTAGSNSSA